MPSPTVGQPSDVDLAEDGAQATAGGRSPRVSPVGTHQCATLVSSLIADDSGWEVTIAWHAYQQLRSLYQAKRQFLRGGSRR